MSNGILKNMDVVLKSFDNVRLAIFNYAVYTIRQFAEDKTFNYDLMFGKTKVGMLELMLLNREDDCISNMKLCANEVPEKFFYLQGIDIFEKYQNMHLGTQFLNFVLKDIENYNKAHNTDYKLLFYRSNSRQTIPFYKKFDARYNDINPTDKYDKYCYMIIDEPKHNEKFDGKKVCPIKLIKAELQNKQGITTKDIVCEKQY